MGNIPYRKFRFENAHKDLEECLGVLNEAGGIKEAEDAANFTEGRYIRKLVELCRDVVDAHGEELNSELNSE
jgi:hypothetical protein